MLEPPGTPTFLGMNAEEWHAFGYGLKDGIKIWNRTHILYSNIDKLDESDVVKTALKNKWHYYEIGSDLPEDIVLLAGIVYTGLKSAGIL
jgi:hypothetical protein